MKLCRCAKDSSRWRGHVINSQTRQNMSMRQIEDIKRTAEEQMFDEDKNIMVNKEKHAIR